MTNKTVKTEPRTECRGLRTGLSAEDSGLSNTTATLVAQSSRLSPVFADYITEHLKTPFAWGTNDCITFSIGWVEIATGQRYLPDPWASELEAARIIKGYGGLVEALDAHFRRIHPNYARDGDIAICAGVVSLFSGPHVVAPGPEGLVFKLRTEADHAWTH